MIVQLVGRSLAGVIALANNQGAIRLGAAIWSGGMWRMNVELDAR